MRNTINRWFLIGLALFSVSCSSDSFKEELPMFDFGTVTFEEPFVGLLDGKPDILVKSLQYPPFCWLSPDTTRLEKTFEISFNEECIRSKSEATLMFRDFRYNPIQGITIYHNGKECPNGELTIKADAPVKELQLSLSVSPSLKDAFIEGTMLIKGEELDMVNELSLMQESNLISNWQCRQEIEWPIWLWLLWLLTALLIIFLIVRIVRGVIYLKGIISNVSMKTAQLKKGEFKEIKLEKEGKGKTSRIEEKKQKKEKYNKELILLSHVFMDKSASISQKAVALEKIRRILDGMDEITKEKEFQLRPVEIRDRLDVLWEKYDSPKNGWTGERCNSIWIPNDDLVPPNRHYNNRYGKNWRQLKTEYNISGIPFVDGYPDFSGIAKDKVEINFDETNYDRYTDGIHNAAFKKLAEKWNCTVQEARAWKEEHNYMWHEDYDCKTVWLVPREIHDNVVHFGGIGLCKIVRGIYS